MLNLFIYNANKILSRNQFVYGKKNFNPKKISIEKCFYIFMNQNENKNIQGYSGGSIKIHN